MVSRDCTKIWRSCTNPLTSSMDQVTDVHLRWNHHQTTLISVFSSLLNNENLVDCTISAEGQHFKAHRLILSACSPYFESLFSQHYEKHPIVILPDVKFQILKALLEFMYSGEVKIPQDMLHTVFELADTLQIKGLSVMGESDKVDDLSSVGGNEIKEKLRPKRRNESYVLCDQQSFKKHLSKHRSDSKVKQREDVSSLHTSEKEHPEDIDHCQLASLISDKSNSSSVSPKRTDEEAPMFQHISDNDAFSMLQCSSVTKTLIKSNTHLPGTLSNSDSNILDSSQLPGYSRVKVDEQTMSDDNVISTNTSREELRTSSSSGVSGERPTADLLLQMKQEGQDDFNSSSIEEIILDDDTDENDDNIITVGVRVIPDDSFSGQGFCNVEQYRDTYFLEPASLLPNQFKCNTCSRSYRYQRGLWRHLKYECGKEPQFVCCHCPRKFFHKYDLKMHISKIHLTH